LFLRLFADAGAVSVAWSHGRQASVAPCKPPSESSGLVLLLQTGLKSNAQAYHPLPVVWAFKLKKVGIAPPSF